MFITIIPFFIIGCAIGANITGVSAVYMITSACALASLMAYCLIIKRKEPWFLVLFASVLIVNIGYMALSLSKTIHAALMANRIAYLGSVFLPISMLMIVRKVCEIKYRTWFTALCIVIGVFVFCIAASPGLSDIYYKSVRLHISNGNGMLIKEYGPWHKLYLFYLLGGFAAMIGTVFYAIIKKPLSSALHATVLVIAVFTNLAVWLLEQFVKINFEFLSVSYIISELFLLGIYAMMQQLSIPKKQKASPSPCEPPSEEALAFFISQIPTLTPTERSVYELYRSGKGTKEVLQALNISENTLKYHNKNIYSKLGVKSRKQLLQLAVQTENRH